MLGLSLAATTAAANAPLPRAKPVPPSTEAALASAPSTAPLPRAKPARPAKPAAAAPARRAWPQSTGGWPKAEVLEARAACEKTLAGLDMIWRPDEPIGEPGGCGTPAPIAIAEVAQIRIDPPATVDCEFAVALNAWFTQSVQPEARKQVGASVIGVRNASSYACRRRNNAKSGKLSEHARANALDIAAFDFSRTAQVTVAGGASGLLQKIGLSAKGNFMKALRKSACGYFNTVLGPGADRYHGDHFHVDLMKLRPGRFKMCR
ncbi:MAG TPA: extensin family protein [Nordella sp.]|nr:extensin family protein [Nordella sp.]